MLEPGDTDRPHTPSESDPGAPAGSRRARGPRRKRVSELARELGLSSREVLTRLADLGVEVRSASSAVDDAVADRLRAELQPADEGSLDGATDAAGTAEPPPVPEADPSAPAVLFVAPSAVEPAPPSRRRRRAASAPAGPPTPEPVPADADLTVAEDLQDHTAEPEDIREAAVEEATGARRRRRRGRRGRGGRAADSATDTADDEAPDTAEAQKPARPEEAAAGEAESEEAVSDAGVDESDQAVPDEAEQASGTRRRRRRRRSAGAADAADEDAPNTVTHVREPRAGKDDTDDGVRGVKGSTRLEARRQRRRDGRDTGRRRPPILTEAEFLARREAVDRVMAVRQTGERTQVAVLEDGILVEHYVTRAQSTSYVGNVYLGRVQNVLPSMEAAFIDIGKGRNGVLYAGEVNWDAAGLEGRSRAIEQAMKSGDAVLVQVTKDPIGHKGARLTSQISLPGRFLVYVPGGGMTGISRKLPDTERHRLKSVLKKIVPEDGGVIVRTAAEGASEEDLTRDVERLTAQWETIQQRAKKTSAAPTLVHGEPDLAIRVVRDVFNEDFASLLVQGQDAWNTVSEYIEGVAPDLAERVSKYPGSGDIFADLRVDEQLMKALDRKVWLPSGGSLVIDRTEAMTVIDVNTGKFVGAGGNLEQTVTRNNLEAAEEIVRQLRLRDVGGIVVIDFIDMVLESNRDLVLRRLTECLGRDRTKHQVAEVTSLGLVQMTRKRVGEGLLEAFSEPCEVCKGRGVLIHAEPVDRADGPAVEEEDRGKSRKRRGKKTEPADAEAMSPDQRAKALEAMAAVHRAAATEDGDDLDLEAFHDADDSDILPGELGDAEPVDVSAETTAAPVDVDAPEETTAELASVNGHETPSEPAASGRRPRRRRAATRPAGPPHVD